MLFDFLFMMATGAAEVVNDVAEAVNETAPSIENFGPMDYLMTTGGLIVLALVFVAPLFLAAIPANIAQKKGRSFGGYYLFGYFALIPAIIVTLVQKPVEEPEKPKTKSMMEKAGKRR